MIQDIHRANETVACESEADSARLAYAGVLPAANQVGIRLACHAQGLLGLVAALAAAAMTSAPAYPGWSVAIATGLLTCGICHALRQDSPGWPLEELAVGMVLCLTLMLLPWLHAVHGEMLWLYVVPLIIAGMLLLLWLLTRRSLAATIAGRAMLSAVPPLATLMHHFS